MIGHFANDCPGVSTQFIVFFEIDQQPETVSVGKGLASEQVLICHFLIFRRPSTVRLDDTYYRSLR